MLSLTSAELVLLNGARRELANGISYIQFFGNPARDIAAVRYRLGIGVDFTYATKLEYRVLLCKLIEINPKSADVYIVTDNLSVLKKDSRIARLYTRYVQQVVNSGYGFWRNISSENVLYALYLNQRAGAVSVIPRNALSDLLATYNRQEASSMLGNTAAQEKSAVELMPLTASDRKRAAVEQQGRCFGCDAPKPKGRACAVCGYVSRNAAAAATMEGQS